MDTFGERLKEWRLQAGLSARELATAVGLKSEKSIWRYEKDEHDPPLGVLIGMADFFGVTLDELAGRGEPSPVAEPVLIEFAIGARRIVWTAPERE